MQRIDPEGGWHHVMNRGAGRQTVFHLEADGSRFLALVGEGAEMSGVRVLAYALMSNHYHLLLHCPVGGLSDFMHRLGSMYTRYFNVRTASDGPIFRGRFHSLPVTTPEYLDHAGRYIHRNPLDVRPRVRLDEYRWSSYRFYVGAERPPAWLSTDELGSMHADPPAYREFVEGTTRRVPAVEWAIDTALMEFADSAATMTPHIRRTLMLAMLERADAGLACEIDFVLSFPTPRARTAALRRVRQRLAADPVVAALADRALRLAG
jgi:REP element-mobilizing transposase RayT